MDQFPGLDDVARDQLGRYVELSGLILGGYLVFLGLIFWSCWSYNRALDWNVWRRFVRRRVFWWKRLRLVRGDVDDQRASEQRWDDFQQR